MCVCVVGNASAADSSWCVCVCVCECMNSSPAHQVFKKKKKTEGLCPAAQAK